MSTRMTAPARPELSHLLRSRHRKAASTPGSTFGTSEEEENVFTDFKTYGSCHVGTATNGKERPASLLWGFERFFAPLQMLNDEM
jgi:hypothetical protein